MSQHPKGQAPTDPLADGVYDCETGKIGWPSKSKAKQACKRQSKRGGSVTAVYKCPYCPNYHTTKQPQRCS